MGGSVPLNELLHIWFMLGVSPPPSMIVTVCETLRTVGKQFLVFHTELTLRSLPSCSIAEMALC